MTTKDAIRFVKDRGIVLESGHGTVPNLAEMIAGGPIRGSWWGHPKGQEIWKITRALREAREILVCRLVDGKVSYVHRRLWPALIKLARRIHPDRLAAIHEVHLPSGRHEVRTTPFPDWVPREVMESYGAGLVINFIGSLQASLEAAVPRLAGLPTAAEVGLVLSAVVNRATTEALKHASERPYRGQSAPPWLQKAIT